MDIYLHIGGARTGSTSFQTAMAKAADDLRAERICYPATNKADPRHMPLFWSAVADRLDGLHPWHRQMHDGLPLKARIAATITEAGDADRLILSSEWFSIAFEETVFQEMVSELSRYGDVTAIAVLRDQADVMVSAWTRRIMDREPVGPLGAMTAQVADWDKAVRPLDHHATIRNWSGMCKVKLLRYSPESAANVARACGITSKVDFARLSQSIPLDLCDYLRCRLDGSPAQPQWQKLLRDLQSHPDRFAAFVRPEIQGIADTLKTRVRAEFANSNDRLETEFGHLFV